MIIEKNKHFSIKNLILTIYLEYVLNLKYFKFKKYLLLISFILLLMLFNTCSLFKSQYRVYKTHLPYTGSTPGLKLKKESIDLYKKKYKSKINNSLYSFLIGNDRNFIVLKNNLTELIRLDKNDKYIFFKTNVLKEYITSYKIKSFNKYYIFIVTTDKNIYIRVEEKNYKYLLDKQFDKEKLNIDIKNNQIKNSKANNLVNSYRIPFNIWIRLDKKEIRTADYITSSDIMKIDNKYLLFVGTSFGGLYYRKIFNDDLILKENKFKIILKGIKRASFTSEKSRFFEQISDIFIQDNRVFIGYGFGKGVDILTVFAKNKKSNYEDDNIKNYEFVLSNKINIKNKIDTKNKIETKNKINNENNLDNINKEFFEKNFKNVHIINKFNFKALNEIKNIIENTTKLNLGDDFFGYLKSCNINIDKKYLESIDYFFSDKDTFFVKTNLGVYRLFSTKYLINNETINSAFMQIDKNTNKNEKIIKNDDDIAEFNTSKYLSFLNKSVKKMGLPFFIDGIYNYEWKNLYKINNKVSLIKKDLQIKGVYLPVNRIKTKDRIIKQFDYLSRLGINAVVIDFKDDFGNINYLSNIKIAKEIKAIRNLLNLDFLIEYAKKKNIKIIARVVSFKDPKLFNLDNGKYAFIDKTTGKSWVGLPRERWVDPASPLVQQYLIDIANELSSKGIYEIQFDYVRYPSDGKVSNIISKYNKDKLSKNGVLYTFLKNVKEHVKIPISADFYGYQCFYKISNHIGQDLYLLSNYINAIYPMYYPSHFSNGFYQKGISQDKTNYYIYNHGVKRVMQITKNKIYIRPWIQAFKWKVNIDYIKYIQSQIDGLKDAGINSFIFWNSSGSYDVLKNIDF